MSKCNNAFDYHVSIRLANMIYSILADIIVVIHLLFVLFVLLGGLLVLHWRFLGWVHIPAVCWAVMIEFSGWICPLTPLENFLRIKGGSSGYATGFVEHYIIPLLYPSHLTRGLQIFLGFLVIVVNLAVYLRVWYKRERTGGKKTFEAE